MTSEKTRSLLGQVLSPRQFLGKTFYRFVLVGCSNFVVSFSVFTLCLRAPLSFPYKTSISQLVAYAVATSWSFFWNRKLTFRSSGPVVRQATKFVLLQVSMAVISAGLIGYVVDVLGFAATPTWLVVMSAITAANFILSRWWAFK